MTTKYISKSEAIDFLFREYEHIQKMRENSTQQSEARVTLYFVTITGILAILTWMYGQAGSIVTLDPAIPIFILGYFVVLGLLSYFRLLYAHIGIVIYTRALNRIRCFFVENSVDFPIKKAIWLPLNDAEPKFGGFGFEAGWVTILGLTGIVGVMNSTLMTIIVAIYSLLIVKSSSGQAQSACILTFMIMLVFQIVCASLIFKSKEDKYRSVKHVFYSKKDEELLKYSEGDTR